MDMHAISEKSVMEQVAVIPQNVYVFEDTLRNNITLFDPYTEEEVDMAVKRLVWMELYKGWKWGWKPC